MTRTRGGPSLLMNALVNPALVALLRSSAGVVLGRRLAVVHYVGRRTGRAHELVVLYRLDGVTVHVRVGGADRKQWWRNFTTPHPVVLHLAGREVATSAHAVRDGDAVCVRADVRVAAPRRSTSPETRHPAPTSPTRSRSRSEGIRAAPRHPDRHPSAPGQYGRVRPQTPGEAMNSAARTDLLHDEEHPLVRLRAGDVMTGDVATVSPTATVGEAMTLMRTLGIRHLPVIGNGRFIGIVDDRLVAFALLTTGGFGRALEQPVSTAMTQYVSQVGPGEPLQRVAHLLRTSRCDAIVVIDAQEHLLGIITMVDVVSAIALSDVGELPDLAAGAVTATGARS